MSTPAEKLPERQLVSMRQLAVDILGLKKNSGYLTKLKQQGILNKCFVKVEGRHHPLIDPEIAIQEIEKSHDPQKKYVRDMWNKYRNGDRASGDSSGGKGGGIDEGDAAAQADTRPAPVSNIDDTYAHHRNRKASADADRAEIETAELAGRTCSKALVEKMAEATAVLVRNGLKQMPEQVAQLLAAETDPVNIIRILEKEINQILNAFSDEIRRSTDS